MSSKDYIPQLSKPGGLEFFDSEIATGTLKEREKNTMAARANQDFHSIKVQQKLTEDVSQMLVSEGLDLDDFKSSYNRRSKANIPKYNIKCTKTKDLEPFMSPKHLRDVDISDSQLEQRMKEIAMSGKNSPKVKKEAKPAKLTKA